MKKFWPGLMVGAALAAALAVVALWISLGANYRGFQNQAFVLIERGAGSRAIAQALAQAGVIQHPWQFLAMRALTPSATLQAGEYRFADAASARVVFNRIASGDVHRFPFTVPEGANIFDIAQALEAQGILRGEEFLRAAADPSLIRDLAPQAPTLEGYLFPSTYQLSRFLTAAELCRMMTREFRRQWSKLAPAAASPATGAVHAAVTLASLVEEETAVAAERPLVASVFANRLRRPMRLECDPTVVYAAQLEKRYTGAIRRSDLDRRSAYNTYQHDGLPPGPIANPGVAALAAALHPAATEFLFFVAKPQGGSHVFSATLAAHEKAVRSYRHGSPSDSRARKRAAPAPRKAG